MAPLITFPKMRRCSFEALYESGQVAVANGGDWDNVEHQASAPDPIASQDFARTGTWSQKSQCTGINNYRSELSQQNKRWYWNHDGEERYYGFSFYLVGPWPNTGVFQSIAQWHQDNGTPGSPPMTVAVNSDPTNGVGQRSTICLGGGVGGALNYPGWSQVIMSTVTDQWIDLVVYVKWTSTVGTSQVRAWANGVAAFNLYTVPSTPLIYPDAGSGALTYPKLGYYRDGNLATTNTVYHDNYRIGSTYAAVAP